MARFWRQIIKSEQGQVLPIVLVLLVIGGLIIAPTLNYASTSLNAGLAIEENLRGVYAADAGIEYVLWHLQHFEELPEELPVEINGMVVTMVTEEEGNYALALGDFADAGGHYDYLTIAGEFGDWVEEEEAYLYTITIILQVQETIHLNEVGVRLPVGYEYKPGSADIDGNLSTGEPTGDTLDRDDAHMLVWELGTPAPDVSKNDREATQKFYVTGEGEQEGAYTWVVTGEADIGIVSELVGTLYRITATATYPGDEEPIIAEVTADVLLMEYGSMVDPHIIFWQINPEQE